MKFKWLILGVLTICILEQASFSHRHNKSFQILRLCVNGYEFVLADNDDDGVSLVQTRVVTGGSLNTYMMKTCRCTDPRVIGESK